MRRIDAYSNGGGGFNLTEQDSINFVQKLAAAASKYGLSTGLKNAQEILPQVSSVVQFAVNEECVTVTKNCNVYDDFLDSKPVFHVEYAHHSSATTISSTYDGFTQMSSDEVKAAYCIKKNPTEAAKFSTIIKELALDGWVLYCDNEATTTPGSSS